MEGNSAPDRIGPYRILDLLGEGGSGKVYLAQVSPDDPPVALKVLHEPTSELLERFRREAELMASLESPFVARFIEAKLDSKEGPPYLVTECIIGRHIDEVVEQEKLSTDRILELLIHVCEGLSCAHRKGFLHRDLKPSNILVDSAYCPKLIDFGLARPISPDSSNLTDPGGSGPPGTLAYMSPEQLEDKSTIDERSDIYSLGAVAYALLSPAGHPPHGEVKNPVQYLTRKLRSDPRALNPTEEVPGKLSDVIGKAIRAKRSRRYRNVRSLRRDLDACHDRYPTSIQRRRWMLVLVPLLAVLSIIGFRQVSRSIERLEESFDAELLAKERLQRSLADFKAFDPARFDFGKVNVDFEKCAFAFPPGYEVTFTLDAGVHYTDYIKWTFRDSCGLTTNS